jgi:biopolymer transport protein ExbD
MFARRPFLAILVSVYVVGSGAVVAATPTTGPAEVQPISSSNLVVTVLADGRFEFPGRPEPSEGTSASASALLGDWAAANRDGMVRIAADRQAPFAAVSELVIAADGLGFAIPFQVPGTSPATYLRLDPVRGPGAPPDDWAHPPMVVHLLRSGFSVLRQASDEVRFANVDGAMNRPAMDTQLMMDRIKYPKEVLVVLNVDVDVSYGTFIDAFGLVRSRGYQYVWLAVHAGSP